MRATPLPESWEGVRAVIGPDDPTRDDMRAAEYAVRPSLEWRGAHRFMVRVEPTDDERTVIANGGVLWLEMDGGELPWSIVVTDQDDGVPE